MKAVPPNDYIGTIADWIRVLNERGYDGEDYLETEITLDEWREMLEQCEEGVI